MFKRLGIIIGIVAVALIFIFVLMNQDNSSEVTIDALDRGALRVAVHSGLPGMGYHQYMDEDLEGLEVELAAQLASEIFGSESLIDLKEASSKTALYLLANNDVDCVIATQIDNKSSDYLYTESYYTDTVRVIYKDGNYSDLSSFDKDQKIGVVSGSAAETYLEDMLDDIKDPPKIYTLGSYPDAKEWLEAGKIDAFCASDVFLYDMQEYSGFSLGDCDYVIVVRKGESELRDKLDEALEKLRDNGTLNDLIQKWL